jgi:ABC-type phosphate transport system substrate-binding protein
MAIFCFIFIFLFQLASADTGPRGKAFTDPSYQVRMPKDWVAKPVKYDEESKNADIVVTLEQDVYHAIVPLIQKYAKDNGLKIAVKEGTCGIAAGMLSRKAVDIGGFCCPPGSEDRLPGLRYHTLGIVAKAILVHHDNPVSNVSAKQAQEIFAGKIFRWSELATDSGQRGPEWTIQPIGRFHCQKRPGHWLLILSNENLFSPRLKEVGSIPDMIAKVASQKNAIGWEVLGMVQHYENIGRVKALKINGHSPMEVGALVTRKYPFYRTYNITTWKGKGLVNPRAKKLVSYLLAEVDHLDPKLGFAPSSRLKRAGWKFKDDELISEPE